MPMPKEKEKENSPHCGRRGRRHPKDDASRTLPSSPTRSFSSSSASSSDFEFTVVVSPRKSTSSLCPADELFYKGQLLPLQLSPRISMVRTLLFSSSCSSSDASRDSTGSSNDSLLLDSSCCDSSRPSSVTADHNDLANDPNDKIGNKGGGTRKAKHGYFGLSKFSSVFLRREIKQQQRREGTAVPGPVKRMSATAKEVIGKYLKKVKPIYEKLSSQKQQKSGGVPSGKKSGVLSSRAETTIREIVFDAENTGKNVRSIVNPFSNSFSGNLRYPRKRSCPMSCPSSMHSSPSHSGLLIGGRLGFSTGSSSDVSSMEELQNAIQGAIAHCKNSMSRNEVDNICHVGDREPKIRTNPVDIITN